MTNEGALEGIIRGLERVYKEEAERVWREGRKEGLAEGQRPAKTYLDRIAGLEDALRIKTGEWDRQRASLRLYQDLQSKDRGVIESLTSQVELHSAAAWKEYVLRNDAQRKNKIMVDAVKRYLAAAEKIDDRSVSRMTCAETAAAYDEHAAAWKVLSPLLEERA